MSNPEFYARVPQAFAPYVTQIPLSQTVQYITPPGNPIYSIGYAGKFGGGTPKGTSANPTKVIQESMYKPNE